MYFIHTKLIQITFSIQTQIQLNAIQNNNKANKFVIQFKFPMSERSQQPASININILIYKIQYPADSAFFLNKKKRELGSPSHLLVQYYFPTTSYVFPSSQPISSFIIHHLPFFFFFSFPSESSWLCTLSDLSITREAPPYSRLN